MTKPSKPRVCGRFPGCENVTDAIHGTCQACIHRIVVESRAKQGLPPKIEDDAIYDLAVSFVLATRRERAEAEKRRRYPLPADDGTSGPPAGSA